MQLTKEYGPAVRAQLPNGMLVTVDGDVRTAWLAQATTGGTQGHGYAGPAQGWHLFEDPSAVLIWGEQTAGATLGILFLVYGYFSYTFQRYSGQSVVVNGTGFAPPSFA